jgi:hypothetical protein
MKKVLLILVVAVVLMAVVSFLFGKAEPEDSALTQVNVTPEVTEVSNEVDPQEFTERYSAQVDRVKVVFEHTNFTSYRLTTNDLVREGELNTERGFEDDPDATVFVLNWQQPEGEQMYYVRLTDEPGRLYALDSDRKIIRSGALILEE